MMRRQRLPGRCERRSRRDGAIACPRLTVGLVLLSVDSVDRRRGRVGVGIGRFIAILGLMRRPEVFQ